MLHMGTLAALLAYFWRDVLALIAAGWPCHPRAPLVGAIPDRRLALCSWRQRHPGRAPRRRSSRASSTRSSDEQPDRHPRSSSSCGAAILFVAERAARHVTRDRADLRIADGARSSASPRRSPCSRASAGRASPSPPGFSWAWSGRRRRGSRSSWACRSSRGPACGRSASS